MAVTFIYFFKSSDISYLIGYMVCNENIEIFCAKSDCSGIKNVFSLFGKSDSPKKRTFESDPQQATDAALKAMGLAYMIYKYLEWIVNLYGMTVSRNYTKS